MEIPIYYRDRQIIEAALKEAKVFTKIHVETHIIIGTSLYMDHFHESLNNYIPFWNSRIQKMLGLGGNYNRSHYQSHNLLTLLNGRKKTFATKDQVRQAYVDTKHKKRDGGYTSSVNDDFEIMNGRIYNFFHSRGHEHDKTFLYEML